MLFTLTFYHFLRQTDAEKINGSQVLSLGQGEVLFLLIHLGKVFMEKQFQKELKRVAKQEHKDKMLKLKLKYTMSRRF